MGLCSEGFLYTEGFIIGRKFAFRKWTGLIIGGKLLSAIFHSANFNIGALTRN